MDRADCGKEIIGVRQPQSHVDLIDKNNYGIGDLLEHDAIKKTQKTLRPSGMRILFPPPLQIKFQCQATRNFIQKAEIPILGLFNILANTVKVQAHHAPTTLGQLLRHSILQTRLADLATSQDIGKFALQT